MHSVTSAEELYGIQDTKSFIIARSVDMMFVDGVLLPLFEIWKILKSMTLARLL